MHQHPRPPPVTASPASSQRTNPQRTNNPRESEQPSSRTSIDLGSPTEAIATEAENAETTPRAQRVPADGRDSVAKLNQVVQNFYTKAALLILSQRVPLSSAMSKETGEKRVNKWFNVEVDETNDLLDSLRLWKSSHIQDQRPPAMIVEVYIEAAGSGQQSLILQDELGHQWGVQDAIKSYIETNSYGEKMPNTPRVVLERWRCQLGRQGRELPSDLATILPKVYKNSIVLFRSLFAYLKLLPTWELTRKRHLKSSQRPPKLKYRVYEEGRSPDTEPAVFDELELALDDGRSSVTEHFAFDPIESPAGPYTVEITFRRRCDFRWERSMESVYSSKFIGQDEDLFRPSLDRYNTGSNFPERENAAGHIEVGSVPQRRPNLMELAEQSQAYGSMSTYHNTNARISSSPMSALRAARELNMRSPSDHSPPHKDLPGARGEESRAAGRLGETAPLAPRRTSVSFMPFKTQSLSASPLQGETLAAAPHRQPVQPVGRQSALSALADARRPSNASLNPAPRASPVPPSDAPASLSSSPRPPSGRYSSSFGHRRARPSVGGSKTEDEGSSGKASLASSMQPGSTVIPGGNNSSGSLNTDDDNISDFLKMLDQTRDLKSFQAPSESSMEASRRTASGLSKFQRLRDTNSALTESMTTSLQMQRTASAPQRQPATGPAVGTSVSATSSSPAERMSPRTPHTPAVPSRLSANSIIDYSKRERVPETGSQPIVGRAGATTQATVAIDIPTSPRFNPSYRRSSSAVHREGSRVVEYDLGDALPFAMRSASMGDRDEARQQPVPMTELLSPQDGSSGRSAALRAAQARLTGGVDMARQRSEESQKSNEDESPLSPRSIGHRPRLSSGGGSLARRGTHGSSTSLAAQGGVGSRDDVRSSRYSFNQPKGGNFEDEEPLLFAMSDFGTAQQQGQSGRKSLEEHPRRGGGERGGRTWT